ncbi:hypothetical protein B0H14DRAFT_3492246 [Mycena olivaceomarginata]|nr:hypothetical protein B0H14DRAFT_3492246 [Mycena olivaceomarginata]
MTHPHSLTTVALALLLASSCCTELVNFRPLPLHWNKNKLSGPTKQAPDPLVYSGLLDIVLVPSVDGKLHALNRTMGHTLWSMVSSSSSTTDPDLTDNYLNACQETYIIEPQSGNIYVLAPPAFAVRPAAALPVLHARARRHKVRSEVVVELETGAVQFGGANMCPWGPFPDLDEWDGHEPPLRRGEVVLGRTGVYVPGDA